MKVLVVGKGAREHALVWKIAQSFYVDKVYCYPGNAGIAEIAEIPQIKEDSVQAIADFAASAAIDLTVVGPEDYLAKGIVNEFSRRGLPIFGVSQEAAQLESSKAFAKEVMKSADIPTAAYSVVTTMKEGEAVLKKSKFPVVLKADGLAAGKGVVICETREEAEKELADMLGGKFKSAGETVVIEEFLKGEELSLLLITDGDSVKNFLFSQDHKAVSDGDTGKNTGGMGAYTPVSLGTDELYQKIDKTITQPLLAELKRRKIVYRGILYIGLMLVEGEPYVLEFNVRFGDPETEPLMFMLVSDIVPYFLSAAENTRFFKHQNPPVMQLEMLPDFLWHQGYGISVVLASKGYPDSYEKGKVITGLDEKSNDFTVFHAGTKLSDDGRTVTDGGRVLMVTTSGKTIREAIDNVYKNVDRIKFDGIQFRHDIAFKELKRESDANR
ncbi:phosphoribosylamine--glycine ligase [bacterium]|nr:phosphoribosylamine--glycine ligase [bacterium]